jgi:hypothetical protein
VSCGRATTKKASNFSKINLKEKFNQANKYKAYEVTIEKCKEQNLMQAAYFIDRNLSFTRDV